MVVLRIVVVIGFVALIAYCLWLDKNVNKKFQAKFEKEHPEKDRLGGFIITQKDELCMLLGSGTLIGFKCWKLSEIRAINTYQRNINGSCYHFHFTDVNGMVMKGNYLTPSRKPVLQGGMDIFDAQSLEELQNIADFVKKHAPNVEHLHNGEHVIGTILN